MRKTLIILISIFTLISCNENTTIETINVNFDNIFPKRPKNILYKLGKEFSIKHNKDTLTFNVSYDKNSKKNFIINKNSNDTIFEGIINKYRGLYYFNKQINDSSYWIYAVKINNDIIKGLGTDWIQMSYLNDEIYKSFKNNSKLKEMISFLSVDTNFIRLTPDKKILKDFYYSIIDSFPSDTFIQGFDETYSNLSNINDIDNNYEFKETSSNEMILKLYPNPADEFIIIETDVPNENIFSIYNIYGQSFICGKLIEKETKIDVSELKSGEYFIVLNKENGKRETKKFIIK